MSLPQAIKTMLQDVAGVADANITYGTRNQQAGLPAITYLITANEILSIGADTVNSLKRCTVEIRCYDKEAEDCQTLGDAVVPELDTGTYNTIEFCGISNTLPLIEQPTSGEGEESEPFVCVLTATIYYKE